MDFGILDGFSSKGSDQYDNMSINGYCMGLKGSNNRLRST